MIAKNVSVVLDAQQTDKRLLLHQLFVSSQPILNARRHYDCEGLEWVANFVAAAAAVEKRNL